MVKLVFARGLTLESQQIASFIDTNTHLSQLPPSVAFTTVYLTVQLFKQPQEQQLFRLLRHNRKSLRFKIGRQGNSGACRGFSRSFNNNNKFSPLLAPVMIPW